MIYWKETREKDLDLYQCHHLPHLLVLELSENPFLNENNVDYIHIYIISETIIPINSLCFASTMRELK